MMHTCKDQRHAQTVALNIIEKVLNEPVYINKADNV